MAAVLGSSSKLEFRVREDISKRKPSGEGSVSMLLFLSRVISLLPLEVNKDIEKYHYICLAEMKNLVLESRNTRYRDYVAAFYITQEPSSDTTQLPHEYNQ